jgi:transposase
MTMSCDDAGTKPVRRIEVFTGAGRRREWSDEVRASILAESFSGSETVCDVARRHGLAPSQLFTWRRELRKRLEGQGLTLPTTAVPAPSFVPAVIEPALASAPPPVTRQRRRSRASAIELEIDGVAVKIGSGADKRTITAVIEALKATR